MYNIAESTRPVKRRLSLTPEELAAELGEEARMLSEDPEEWYSGFMAEVTEVDRRVLERPEVRAIAIGMFREAVRQGAVGWVDDVLRLGRPWPFTLDEVAADVRFHHGEDDANAPPQHAKELAQRISGSRLRLYSGEGHISIWTYPKVTDSLRLRHRNPLSVARSYSEGLK